MQNKNFYREFNLPPKPKYDWETIAGGVLLALVIISFSLFSYGFWDWIFKIIGGK
ncbi:hypothetical protein [Lactobacillus helveticus]|uniref:hypothetical protein n=1 Tax=Lactobacillus helveticus TaxID=1587 RepID=UPI001C1DEE9D|nr:hypothetical protein [Lactobacillus helveticus]MBU5980066.1 hypothetical protein [Lactobacillus helveticus]